MSCLKLTFHATQVALAWQAAQHAAGSDVFSVEPTREGVRHTFLSILSHEPTADAANARKTVISISCAKPQPYLYEARPVIPVINVVGSDGRKGLWMKQHCPQPGLWATPQPNVATVPTRCSRFCEAENLKNGHK